MGLLTQVCCGRLCVWVLCSWVEVEPGLGCRRDHPQRPAAAPSQLDPHPCFPPLLAQNLVTLIGGLIVAFTNGWKLSLVVVACLPVMACGAYFHTKMQIQSASKVCV